MPSCSSRFVVGRRCVSVVCVCGSSDSQVASCPPRLLGTLQPCCHSRALCLPCTLQSCSCPISEMHAYARYCNRPRTHHPSIPAAHLVQHSDGEGEEGGASLELHHVDAACEKEVQDPSAGNQIFVLLEYTAEFCPVHGARIGGIPMQPQPVSLRTASKHSPRILAEPTPTAVPAQRRSMRRSRL